MSTVVAPAQTHEENKPQSRSIGWYGMVFFISSEAVFFANLIAVYLYLLVRAGQWPPKGTPASAELDIPLAVVNTIILLSSSIPMHYAGRSIARGNKRGLTIGLILTIILGATFISIQLYEYVNNAFGPSTGVFGSVFYTLTGFHGAHVTVGLLFLTVCFVRSLRGDFSKDHHFAVQAAEMYWHFVDFVWVFIVSLVYFLPLALAH
ncbi:MAG: Cytochrome c oxidase polypeptide III [Ktedonobacterales bacterium]|jgi:heme/copper-type cytochrome/quinol oxidase subunit 3|nr:MAG: Cytochrome c oxidase polypeptide III [Ktedonobacterales bacterium]